jgi:hypothetical protein
MSRKRKPILCPECEQPLTFYKGMFVELNGERLGQAAHCWNCEDIRVLRDGVLFGLGYSPDNPKHKSLPDKCRYVVYEGRTADGQIVQLDPPLGTILVPENAVKRVQDGDTIHYDWRVNLTVPKSGKLVEMTPCL